MLRQQAFEETLTDLTSILVFVVSWTLYTCVVIFILPPLTFRSPDEGVKFLQMQNLRWEDGRLHYAVDYPGRSLDPMLHYAQYPDEMLTTYKGQLYLQRLFVFPALVWPLYQLMGYWGLYVIPSLCAALINFWTAQQLFPIVSNQWRAALLVGFGSPVFIYAILFWEHTPATLLCLIGTGLVRHGLQKQQNRAWSIAGFILGLALYIRPETVLYTAALGAASMLIMWRRGKTSLICALQPVALLAASFMVTTSAFIPLHWLLFTRIIPSNATYLYWPFEYLRRVGINALAHLFVGSEIQLGIATPFWVKNSFTLATLLYVALVWRGATQRWLRITRWSAIIIVIWTGYIMLFSPQYYQAIHGFLIVAPWAIMSFANIRYAWLHGDIKLQLFSMTAGLYLLFYASATLLFRSTGPMGGLEWGARFFLTAYPLLAVLVFARQTIETPTRFHPLVRVTIAALVLLSFAFQGRGLWTIQRDKALGLEWNNTIASLSEEHIVTDVWWLPLNSALLFYDKQMFVTATPTDLHDWILDAAAQDVSRFCLITFMLDTPERLSAATPNGYTLAVINRRTDNLIHFTQIELRHGIK